MCGPTAESIMEWIKNLEALPCGSQVLVRLIELGQDPESELPDYTRLIETDSGLSARIISIVNSPWCGVRQKIVGLQPAIGYLGMANVRSVSIAYCLAGLQQWMQVPPEDAEAQWGASLCKGLAARRLGLHLVPDRAEELYLIGLFQDMAYGLMANLGGSDFIEQLSRPEVTVAEQLTLERARFSTDHAEAGSLLAQKMGLPDVFVRSVGCHHDREKLQLVLGDANMAAAAALVALFPHDMRYWKPQDMQDFCAGLTELCGSRWAGGDSFIQEVQDEFDRLSGFQSGTQESPDLAKLMLQACNENLRLTCMRTEQTHAMNQQNQDLYDQVQELTAQKEEAESRARMCEKLVDLNTELAWLSRIDSLTQVLNRRAWEEAAVREHERYQRHGHPYSILMLDVDFFKLFNDTNGHQAGDQCLQQVARAISGACRSTDVVGRYGGEEFVVLAPETSLEEGRLLAERIRRAVQDLRIVHARSTAGGLVTISAGVSESGTGSWEATARRADEALYAAKTNGRNQVSTVPAEIDIAI